MRGIKHKVKKIVHHEWTIGDESTPLTYKDLHDGIFLAQEEMKRLGVNLDWDDAYHVKAGDGYEVILYVDIKEKD